MSTIFQSLRWVLRRSTPQTEEKGTHSATTRLPGNNEPPARSITRGNAILILITNAVGLGVLSLPYAMMTLGLVSGIIAIIAIGILTGYTAYQFLQIYRRYPTIVNIADIGYHLGGKYLEWLFGGTLVLMMCLTAASCALTLSIALNYITNHGACTVGFTGLASLVSCVLCVPRSMKFCAKMGWPATVSIIAAILVVVISIGLRGPRGVGKDFQKEIVLFGKPSFTEGITAILSITFSFAGSQSFTTVMAEMKSPEKDFLPALLVLQTFNITIYTTVATLLYFFTAQNISPLALGAAAPLYAKMGYGLLIPCVLGSAIVFGNTGVKYLFVITLRALKAEKDEIERHSMRGCTARSWIIWIGYTITFWVVAFVLANSIPVFYSILSIAASIFVAWFTFAIPAAGWFHLNSGRYCASWRKRLLFGLNVVIILIALSMNTIGLYASIIGLLKNFRNPLVTVDGPFTCQDNRDL